MSACSSALVTIPRRLLAGCSLLLLLPAAASAQRAGDSDAVQDVLRFLMTNQGVPTGDFDRDQQASEATHETVSRVLLSSIATLPVSTSSSGFIYRLNPALGTVERASQTFGPFYMERAHTAGAGRASFGVSMRHTSFAALDGYDLRSGEFVTVANQFADEPEPFDVETLTLAITARTATMFANVGVADHVDVAVAVPFVRLDVEGSRLNTYRGRTLLQARARAGTVGLGDVAIRSKVRLTGDGPAAVAAGVEARLPIGREEDLLGGGELAIGLLGIGSYEAGPASVYGNIYFRRGGLGPELTYGGALAVAASPRVTLVGEVLSRRIAGIRRITEVVAPHPRISGVRTMRLTPAGEDQTTVFGVAGFKWNVSGTWLLHGHVLLPLVDSGLTARITPVVALDYSFAQ